MKIHGGEMTEKQLKELQKIKRFLNFMYQRSAKAAYSCQDGPKLRADDELRIERMCARREAILSLCGVR